MKGTFMKWLLLIIFFSFQVMARECLTFRRERIRICIGDKVRHLPSFGKPMVEVMGFTRANPEGKVLILKTGRRIKRMNDKTPEERNICNGCETAGLDQIRVDPENYLDQDEITTAPERPY